MFQILKPEAKAFVKGALFISLRYRNAFVTNKKVNRTWSQTNASYFHKQGCLPIARRSPSSPLSASHPMAWNRFWKKTRWRNAMPYPWGNLTAMSFVIFIFPAWICQSFGTSSFIVLIWLERVLISWKNFSHYSFKYCFCSPLSPLL